MRMIFKIFAFALVRFVLMYTAQEPCITPISRNGVCIPYQKCPHLHEWRDKYDGVLPQILKDYIFQSKCSKDNEKVIRICCDMEFVTSSTTTSTTTSVPIMEQNISPLNMDLDPNVDFLSQLNREGYSMLDQLQCGACEGNRVAGGVETNLNEFPWMAMLKYDGSSDEEFKCGGTLITRRFVLTAAHCVTQPISVISVRLGEHNLETDPDCIGNTNICNEEVQNIGIEKIIVHPDYNKGMHINDIALVKLDREAVFQNNTQPICLPITPTTRYGMPVNASFFIAGWGLTEKGYRSKVLLKANVTHLENSECENCYKHFRLDPNKQLCAGDREGRHDTCKGDSGGPLMRICKYKRKKSFVQYGIVACGGMTCSATRALPGIYTNVVNYLPWITNNIIN